MGTSNSIDFCQESDEVMISVGIDNLQSVCYSIENDDDISTFFILDAVNTIEFH